MTKEEATDLRRLLVEAAAAINLAGAIANKLSREERESLALPLDEIYSALRLELLPAIYDQHPDLKPPPELPAISSTLRWDEVALPSSVSEADIDAILLSCLKPQWRKMAMIVGNATKRSQELALPIGAEIFVARLCALAEAGRIESQGDLRKWRHSEVRLRG
jgi:hypothetical protein